MSDPTADERERMKRLIYNYETIDFEESKNFTTRDAYGVVDALRAAGFGDVAAERERADRLQECLNAVREKVRTDPLDTAGIGYLLAGIDETAMSMYAALTEDQPAVTPEPSRIDASSPHSRACGPRRHEHGYDCHSNCPTCGGVPQATPEPPSMKCSRCGSSNGEHDTEIHALYVP